MTPREAWAQRAAEAIYRADQERAYWQRWRRERLAAIKRLRAHLTTPPPPA